VAAYILGRCLQRAKDAKVAVVVGYFSYLCQEDREIGFRSLLRQRFPEIEIVEVLLRTGVIDFLITQSLESLIRTSRQVLVELRLGSGTFRELNHLPIQIVSEFNLDPRHAA